jgi:hypothetical protein
MFALENYVIWCLIEDEYIKPNNVAPCSYLFSNVPHQSFLRTISFSGSVGYVDGVSV